MKKAKRASPMKVKAPKAVPSDDSEDEVLSYPERLELPTLYNIDKAGNERLWKAWVIDNVVYSTSGLVDGEKVKSKRSYEGKNIGKKNETTPEEQAQLEAQRDWIKKTDKGYKPKSKEGKAMLLKLTTEKKKTGGHNIDAAASITGKKTKNMKVKAGEKMIIDNDLPLIIPMKAQNWTDKSDPLNPPPKVLKYFDFDAGVYCQHKLDGWRCIARLYEGNVVLTSNSGKQYPWFGHLREQIFTFLEGRTELALDGLDGEVYQHVFYDLEGNEIPSSRRHSTIQEMSGMARSTPHPLEDQIALYVFDLVDLSSTIPQDERFRLLDELFEDDRGVTQVVKVGYDIAHSSEEVTELHNKYAAEGYEGVIIRARDLLYKTKGRSLKIRKFKYFIDEEYVVVDVTLDKGVSKDQFVWVCETEDGRRFKAKPEGTKEKRLEMYANRGEYLGKYVTLKFQEYSDIGIPRFPIAKGFRELGDF